MPRGCRTDADELRMLGMAAHAIGNSPLAADLLSRSEARLRAQGRLGRLPHVLLMQVPVRLALGDWSRAAQSIAEGEQLCADTGQPLWQAGAQADVAWAAGLRGDLDTALDVAAKAEIAASDGRLNCFLAVIQISRGAAWLSTGHDAEAYEELRRLFGPSQPSDHQRDSYPGVPLFAEAAVRTHREAEARQVLGDLFDIERLCPSPDLRIYLAYARAVLSADADAEPLFRTALSCNLVRWPSMRARVDLAYSV